MVGVTESGRQTAEAIRREAAELFVTRGYEATGLREIAGKVGIKVGSLYNHIESKEHLLEQLMGGAMDTLLADVHAALEGVEDPVDQVIILVDRHIRYHALEAQTVFLGNSELRSLSESARAEVTAKRREYEQLVQQLVQAAADSGQANVLDARLQTFSIISKGTHVATWFKPGRTRGLRGTVHTYAQMTMRELGVADGDARVDALLGTN